MVGIQIPFGGVENLHDFICPSLSFFALSVPSTIELWLDQAMAYVRP